MSLQWFRFYGATLNNRKAQGLKDPFFKRWVNLLCLAMFHDGVLPDLPDIAFALRISEPDAQKTIDYLRAAGLLDQTSRGLVPHDWDKYQYKSDTSTERTRRYRERHGNVLETSREQGGTLPDSDADSRLINRSIPDEIPSRTAPTVENIIDWQAFSLWAVCGWRRNRDMVLEAIEDRAAGFLEAEAKHYQSELDRGHRCDFYQDFVPALLCHGLPLPTAETKPILQAAEKDSRQDRMLDYLGRCTENPTLCEPWPSFDAWRAAACA